MALPWRLAKIGLVVLVALSATTGRIAAEPTVQLSIGAAGDVSAGIAAVSLPIGRPGSVRIEIVDGRGLGQGWDIVLAVASPRVTLELSGSHVTRVIAGQAISGAGPVSGVVAPPTSSEANRVAGTSSGTVLGEGTSVLRAGPGGGSGTYSLTLAAMALHIPADTNLTLTVGSAP